MPDKCLLILLDGLGDRSYASYDHQTPLQAAETPCLDSLAARAGTGLFHASRYGEALPSENAHFALFGYEMTDFPGRGPLEALGSDIDLAPNDVAILAHFTHLLKDLDGRLILKYDRSCATIEEADELYEAVGEYETQGVKIRFQKSNRLFGVLTLQGDVSPYVTDSNPMIDGRFISEIVPLEGHENDPATIRTAAALTEYLTWAHKELEKHPQAALRKRQKLPPFNGIVTQRAGRLKTPRQFTDRFGLHGASISNGVVYKGIAKYLGLDAIHAVNTGDHARDIKKRMLLAEEALQTHDFVHLHMDAPDKAAHTKNPDSKRKAIAAIDRGLAETIENFLTDDMLVVVTADHSTPSQGYMVHSGEPVPCMFIGDGIRRDNVTEFNEVSVCSGSLGGLRGTEIMGMMLNGLDRARLQGIRDCPQNQDSWPGDYQPFVIK